MKTLLVLRHAKSSWDQPGLADHERPLNKRGEKEAPRVGEHLRDSGLVPGAIVSSPARRAKQTAAAVAEASGCATSIITVEPRLYPGEPRSILAAVRALPESFERQMIVGHNPGMEEFVSELVRSNVELKTAALAVVRLDVERWRDVSLDGRGTLVDVVRGKDL